MVGDDGSRESVVGEAGESSALLVTLLSSDFAIDGLLR
jgi:hypothetical protein